MELTMLIQQYKPIPGEIWYHYCSAESFMSIIKNRTLRLCDIRHMNDKAEMIHGEQLFYEILGKSAISENKKAAISTIYRAIRERIVLLSMSFSANGDQLSQWRGYADDAKGFSIGFEAIYLNDLPVHLFQIEYDQDIQKRLIYEFLSKIENKFPDNLNIKVKDADNIAQLQDLFAQMKNDSFSEEKEFRILHALGEDENGGLFNSFIKGDYKKYVKNKVDFRLVDNIPAPYTDIFYSLDSGNIPIKEVIIGPKNHSDISDIEHFLRTNRIQGAIVSKSKSTYQ